MKKRFYFVAAKYFRFWARLQLRRWRPAVYVITGSSGKTTLLHLTESQLGDQAHYSHHANSAFGVCFDILGLGRKSLAKTEWLGLVLKAPLRAFRRPYKQKIYVAEIDCDRPYEGRFLAELLQPKGLIWLSSSQTHAVNFDHLVQAGKFENVESAIAYEYGWLLEAAREFAIINADNKGIAYQLNRTKAVITKLRNSDITKYDPTLVQTKFDLKHQIGSVSLPALVPKAVGMSALAVAELVDKIGFSLDSKFTKFKLPPGRSSVFDGINKTTLIDSTYNASLDAAIEMLQLFERLPAKTKWLVVSDVLEQGESEKRVHEQLAMAIAAVKADKIIIMGPRMIKYTAPTLRQLKLEFVAVESPREVLDILKKDIIGGETIMFKGTRFLEGVVEHLLVNPEDASKLCRREPVWQKRRKAWGL